MIFRIKDGAFTCVVNADKVKGNVSFPFGFHSNIRVDLPCNLKVKSIDIIIYVERERGYYMPKHGYDILSLNVIIIISLYLTRVKRNSTTKLINLWPSVRTSYPPSSVNASFPLQLHGTEESRNRRRSNDGINESRIALL